MNTAGVSPSSLPVPANDAASEERERRGQLLTDITADLAGIIAKLCDRHPDITPDEIWDRARNGAQALVGNYLVELP